MRRTRLRSAVKSSSRSCALSAFWLRTRGRNTKPLPRRNGKRGRKRPGEPGAEAATGAAKPARKRGRRRTRDVRRNDRVDRVGDRASSDRDPPPAGAGAGAAGRLLNSPLTQAARQRLNRVPIRLRWGSLCRIDVHFAFRVAASRRPARRPRRSLARAESLFQSMKNATTRLSLGTQRESRETIVAETASRLATAQTRRPGEVDRRRHSSARRRPLHRTLRRSAVNSRGRADRARLLGRFPPPLRPGYRPRA